VAVVDSAVRRVLRVKYELGLFANPFKSSSEAREKALTLTPSHRALARQSAQQSIVLLRNEGNLLPLPPTVKTIAVIGTLADDARSSLGGWAAAGRAEDAVTVLAGIRKAVGPDTRVLYAPGAPVEAMDSTGFAEALRIAREADVVVMVVGEHQDMSAEARNRSSLDLPGVQQALVERVHATGKPMVAVLMNGRPLSIPWMAQQVPAIVESWYLGVEHGNAVADVLFGKINPSGRLPITFPRTVGQVPIYYNHLNTGRPTDGKERYTSQYIDVPFTPLYAFGHGLSYTRFQYSSPALSRPRATTTDSVLVSVTVTNAGAVAGDEVVQLYVRDDAGSVARPVQELKGFRRITLAPGAQETVTFVLTPDLLSFYGAQYRRVIEPGTFTVMVGPASDRVQSVKLELSGRTRTLDSRSIR
jgi:beta-glucosidase